MVHLQRCSDAYTNTVLRSALGIMFVGFTHNVLQLTNSLH